MPPHGALARVFSRRRLNINQERGGVETRVEVNQRALIDKVLARYSGEFTFFRELLQNADDAKSSTVEIHFGTATYQRHAKGGNTRPLVVSGPTFNDAEVVQWMFRNNGKPFDERDWERLPIIAEGNPSPDKIGAFGVGFYSLFSVTDRPRVTSGGREMQFYWKDNDNQLYVCHHSVPQGGTSDRWTTFEMPLRVPGPMPPLLDLMRFLASSITFMVNLMAVDVLFDGHRVGHISKSPEPLRAIDVPKEMKRSSPKNFMYVKDVQCYSVGIDAEIVNATFSCMGANSPSSMDMVKSRVELAVFTAEVAVTIDKKTSAELNRCMKKEPPSQLKYSLIYTGKDEYDRSSEEQWNRRPEEVSVFQGLRADLEEAKHTRIFIGHATGQTTGIGGHMASRFIPTVEREAIDFVDNHVSAWNKELLYVGGFLSRAVYELELSGIQHLWEVAIEGEGEGSNLRPSRNHLHSRFLHVLKFFTFHHSTPSQKVAEILRDSFYECCPSPLRLLSTVGVRAAPEIKFFDRQVAKFLDSLPMLLEHVGQEAAHSIEALPDPQKIMPTTIEGVLKALDGHTLSEDQLIFCLQWWLELRRDDSSLNPAGLLNAVAFNDARGTNHTLSITEYFINTQGLGVHIPRDGPFPPSLIPLDISTHFTPTHLTTLGWKELTVIEWFQYISRTDVMLEDPTYDFTKSRDWAERVLYILSRAWSSLSHETCLEVKGVFAAIKCIPTTHGLCSPDNSYLPVGNDTLFRKLDLPVATFSTAIKLDGELRTLLSSIGVQPHIPLEILLDQRLCTREWSTFVFIDYLVRLSPPLTPQQISVLESSKVFSRECPQDDSDNKLRYCANELYPPMDIFRQLQLPVIYWDKKSKWLNESDEAELLYRLGLHRYPPLETIIRLCASPNTSIGDTAFQYFCENLQGIYPEYNPKDFQNSEFIPAENDHGTCLKSPGEVFLGARWRALGFSVVRHDFRKVIISELGIQQHPPRSMLLDFLERTSPPDEEIARDWYECLSDCIQSFSHPELIKISRLRIVPTSFSGVLEWLAPTQCYLGPPTDEFHRKLFAFVGFGVKANHFLSTCGSMKEPSAKDVAECLIHTPDRFYKLAEEHGGFLEKLRDLAARKTHIPSDTLHRMRSQRTLLGERRERAGNQIDWKSTTTLLAPKEIVIVDDSRDYALFSDTIYVAPQDELLERFYSFMGCRRLSTIIHEQYEPSDAIPDIEACSKIRRLILARLPLFLKKCSHSDYDKTRVPNDGNFSVVVCERLLVHKTLITGNDNTPRKQELWATTKHDEGRIEVWLSRGTKRDMYDLAASLCRLLFGVIRVNDTLLLATMLSDLQLLKRAGFDVDEPTEQQPPGPSMDRSTNVDPITSDGPHSSPKPAVSQVCPRSSFRYLPPSITDTFGGARNAYRMVKGGLISSPRSSTTFENAVSLLPARVPCQVIRQGYIRDTVNKATEVYNSRGSRQLDNSDDMSQFLKHHSCNDFEQIKSFRSLGMRESIEFHVAQGISNEFIARKREPLARFIRIITPAASAHNLPTKYLHIFYDADEGPIACNWERNIYLNLRYFEEWHDEDVKDGRLRQAQLSWFFVLAHEIAHNLVSSHDSAHEFWFSAICEARISDFFAAAVSHT